MNNFMNNLANNIRRFMYGRYGFDQLSRGVIILAFLISIAASFSGNYLLVLLTYLPILYVMFRTLSKNITKRTQENQMYYRIIENIKRKLNSIKLSLIGTKTHMYFKCKHCKQTIRVPRGKGKICITCPKCKTEFIKRT